MEKSSQPCPKCGRPYIIGQASCSSCGLVFAKWELKAEGAGVSGSQRLELAWQDVLNRWNEELVHKKFVDQCYREHNLPFATLKYRKVLESDPHSEVCMNMQKRIQEMVISSFITAAPQMPEKVYSNKVIYVFLLLAAFMVVLGLNMPGPYLATGMPLVLVGIFAFVALQLLRKFLL